MSYVSHHGPPSYLEFFFYQKVQRLPRGVGEMVWVVSGEDRATCLELPYGERRNNLHFSVSETQPVGEIVVESVGEGYLKNDASSGMRINTQSNWHKAGDSKPAKVNDSLQRVSKYKLRIPTPLNRKLGESYYQFCDRETEWKYPHPVGQLVWQTLTVGQDSLFVNTSGVVDASGTFIPGTVDLTQIHQLVQQGLLYIINHWWIDNVDRWEPREASIKAKLYWNNLTVDSGQRRVSDGGYPYNPPDETREGTVSSQTYFTPIEVETLEQRWYDTGWHGRVITNINVEHVPNCPIEISYWQEQDGQLLLVSCTTVPLPGRGWLPANRFGEVMEYCEVYPLALGLLALVANKRKGVIVDVLNELIYCWGTVYENISNGALNPIGKGLMPDRFPRYTKQPVTGSRSVVSYAWLGIALCKVAELLTKEEEPRYLDLLLKQIALFVAYNVDTATGVTFDGYDGYDFSSTTHSLKAAALAGIFLNEYLQIQYDALVHNRLCRIQERLHQDQSQTSNPAESWDERFENLTAYLAYLNYYDNEFYARRAARIAKELQEEWDLQNSVDPASAAWFAYNVTYGKYWLLENEIERERWQVKNFLQFRDRDLASYLNDTEPCLTASSWGVIADTEFDIYLEGRFQTNFLEVCAYRDHCFLVMRAFWPFGYLTTAEEKERKEGGVIGSLLFALAEVNYHWFALYSLFRDGMDINMAQGWALDAWGNSYGCPRSGLETDRQYRARLEKEIKPRLCTPGAMYELLEDYFDYSELQEGFVPSPYWIKDEEGNFREQIWTASPEQVNSLPVVNGVKGIYLAPREDSFAPLSKFIPKVEVTTATVLPNGEDIVKRATPTGVPLKVTVLIGEEDFSSIDTVYYLQDEDWGEILSSQVITLQTGLVLAEDISVEDPGTEAVCNPRMQDVNTVRLVYVPAGEFAWLEDGTETSTEQDRLLIVPPGIEVEYRAAPFFGKVAVGNTTYIENYYGPTDIAFYTRDGRIIRLEPSERTLMIV